MRSILLALLLVAQAAQAQLLDSLSLLAREKPRFVLKLDSRGSFISNASVGMLGLKAGLEHGGRFQYGLGYSLLRTAVEVPRTVDGVAAVPTRLHLGYVTPYVEYAFWQRGAWEVRIPVQFGLGSGSLAYRGPSGESLRTARSFILLYEPAMTVQYRFLHWFGVHGGWGYRLVLVRTELDLRLTAPVYMLGLKVFFGDLWRELHQ